MNRPAKFFSALLISIVIIACSIMGIAPPISNQQNVNTIVAGTIQAITAAASVSAQQNETPVASTIQVIADTVPAATPLAPTSIPPNQAGGIPFSFQNVSLVIPKGLASGAAGEQAAEVNDSNGAPWEVAPAHVKLTFTGYPLQGTVWEPVLHFYPVKQFSALDDGAAQIITKLKSIISNPTSLPNYLPFLPMVNANQMFYAQARIIQFKNGTGIRYITQFDQAYLPINNHGLFYTFQGMTGDGNYYISLILPINSPVLPADDKPDSPVPSGGVAFDQNDFSKFPQYISDLTGILNSASSDSFTPSLSVMDELVNSIVVNP